MRKVILSIGIISIIIVTVLNFYKDEVINFLDNIFWNKEYVIAEANNYYLDSDFKYIKNYTDDVKNRQELNDYIYYVINTGSDYADGECQKEYVNCVRDLENIAKDNEALSIMNNFVHPYNSFKSISFTYDDRGRFSLAIEHIYKDEDIALLNSIVNNVSKKIFTENMTTIEKIKAIHDYIINNTQYDEYKIDNIHDTTYRSNTAYGVLKEGYGICSGYSDTMAIFLNSLNIKNYKISNDSHIWNLVYVNGKWLHVDVTWDDPISDTNQNRDTYFLIDTKTLGNLDDKTHYFDRSIYKEAA